MDPIYVCDNWCGLHLMIETMDALPMWNDRVLGYLCRWAHVENPEFPSRDDMRKVDESHHPNLNRDWHLDGS